MIDLSGVPPEQKEIIRMLCQIQLESLQRIAENNDESGEDITMLLIREEKTRAQFEEDLMAKMEKFQDLHDDPEDLTILSEQDLSQFRHLLANVEDHYKDDYPKAVANLWNRLFFIEQTQSLASYPMLLNN